MKNPQNAQDREIPCLSRFPIYLGFGNSQEFACPMQEAYPMPLFY
jgi:hypothetical protein